MSGHWELTVRGGFSAAHALRHYQGKCENLHGHNFQVEATISGDRVDGKTGMLVDFSLLKKYLAAVLAPLDHTVLNETPPFDSINPSSENLARHIAEKFDLELRKHGHCQDRPIKLARVAVAENEKQSASWIPA